MMIKYGPMLRRKVSCSTHMFSPGNVAVHDSITKISAAEKSCDMYFGIVTALRQSEKVGVVFGISK